jgi:predicted secreted protein
MLKRKGFLLILFSLLALSLMAFPGCGKAITTNTSTAPQNPTATTNVAPSGNTNAGPESNNIEPREVAAGKEFAIIIKEDSSSGYVWEANFDAAYLALISTNYISSTGERTFQFKALKKGVTSIVMLLKRPGDEVPKDSKIYIFGIDQSLPNITKDASPVNTNEGEEFTLSTDEEHTGGYQWEAVFDSIYLQLVSSTHNPDTGQRTFHFVALKQGVTALTLILGGLETPQEIRVDTVTIN